MYINISILSKTVNLHCKYLKSKLNLKKLETFISLFFFSLFLAFLMKLSYFVLVNFAVIGWGYAKTKMFSASRIWTI